MPSNYTHYRFGMEHLPDMPEPAKRTIRRFRTLFEAGLHGPDLFFYYNPVMRTPVGKLGKVYHRKTGKEFFEAAAARKPSEGARAYLYGVLAHYCLDVAFHSCVNQWAAEKKAGHTEMETEFERYLLELDGIKPAYTHNSVKHLRPTPGELETIAWAYPPANQAQIRRCFRRMKSIVGFLTTPEGLRRKAIKKVVALSGESGTGHIMGAEPNPRCNWVIKPLLGQYRLASRRFPAMAQQLHELLSRGTPLGEDFLQPFG